MAKVLPGPVPAYTRVSQKRPVLITLLSVIWGCLLILWTTSFAWGLRYKASIREKPPSKEILDALHRCRTLSNVTHPDPRFHERFANDRFVEGTRPVLLKNARVWTGEANGTTVFHADVLLERGLIIGIGSHLRWSLEAYKQLEIVDVNGSWVTPGIIDLHSHLGIASGVNPPRPGFANNSLHEESLPWLRVLDSLQTHDDSFQLSISGGATTALVLPGSAHAIGGQGFSIKLRSTSEGSPTSMLLEPPAILNFPDSRVSHWRHIEHACGENPGSKRGLSRMDNIWSLRKAYSRAKQLKDRQDDYCRKLETNSIPDSPFPNPLRWEALVDVLRGNVKVHVHCYEAVDLNAIIALSNEFQIHIAAFHHAHEAYLIPDLIKKANGQAPGLAMFAVNARYKREAYRGSEFAPRILAQNGLQVVMKSDHPVTNARHLVYEAQQAHFYGLSENLAIASVTSTPAHILGLSHRIGYIKEGWDADLVVWDSHPLALGATPKQVYIDGIPQLLDPHVAYKPDAFQKAPVVPNFDREAKLAVEYEGLPPLIPKRASNEVFVFRNISKLFIPEGLNIKNVIDSPSAESSTVAAFYQGSLVCHGQERLCVAPFANSSISVVDLLGGSISPGLITYGSSLGLEEIKSEGSTSDGEVFDPTFQPVLPVLGEHTLVRAADGLQFGTRSALLAHRAGVTVGIAAPVHSKFAIGLSSSFSTGAQHKFAAGAIIQSVNALHFTVKHFGNAGPSISSQIGILRNLLLKPPRSQGIYGWINDVIKGLMTLVVEADDADIIATIIQLKREVEEVHGTRLKVTISGGLEAWILAKEIAATDIGVIQIPSRPFRMGSEQGRILPGPPVSSESSVMRLLAHNVTVGIGAAEAWSAQNARFDLGWLAIEAGGKIKREQAIALGSTNLRKLLGGALQDHDWDLVATQGGDLLDFGSKIVATISAREGSVQTFS